MVSHKCEARKAINMLDVPEDEFHRGKDWRAQLLASGVPKFPCKFGIKASLSAGDGKPEEPEPDVPPLRVANPVPPAREDDRPICKGREDLLTDPAVMGEQGPEAPDPRHSPVPHTDKTRLLRFGSRSQQNRHGGPSGGESFDFLGFTHHWGKTKKGTIAVQRRTMRVRFTRALRAASIWCRTYRQLKVGPVRDVAAPLAEVGQQAFLATPRPSSRSERARLAASGQLAWTSCGR